eukprot:Gb_25109 [translate_table: standard]
MGPPALGDPSMAAITLATQCLGPNVCKEWWRRTLNLSVQRSKVRFMSVICGLGSAEAIFAGILPVDEMNVGESLQYKAVVVDYNTGEMCYCWMPDPNRSLTIPSDTQSVYFVSVFWDENSCASSCSNTNAYSVGNVGTCSSMTSRLNAWMKYKTNSSIV